jgi:hypothetical protein
MALRRALLRSAASGQLTADALLDAGERQRPADEPRARQAARGAAAGVRGRQRQARPCCPASRVLACFAALVVSKAAGLGPVPVLEVVTLLQMLLLAAPCLRAPVRTRWCGGGRAAESKRADRLMPAVPSLRGDGNLQGGSDATLHTLRRCACRRRLWTTPPSAARDLLRRARRSWCPSARPRGARAARRSGRRAAEARLPRTARRARRSACRAWSGGAPCRGRPGWTSADACAAPP